MLGNFGKTHMKLGGRCSSGVKAKEALRGLAALGLVLVLGLIAAEAAPARTGVSADGVEEAALDGARIPNALTARASSEGAVRVIVELDVATLPEGRLAAPGSRDQQRQRISAAQLTLEEELMGTSHRVARRFRTIPFVALEVDAEGLAQLERSPRVVAVQEDRLHWPTLDVSIPLVEADQTAAVGDDGSGQTVVVIDTGVDAAHPNLSGKIVDEACFAKGDPYLSGDCPNGEIFDDEPESGSHCTFSSDCFHGTHVAGIAVGTGASYPGIAPGAGLISIQVFSEFSGSVCDPGPSPCALTYKSDQIAALEHVFDTLRFSHSIASVNMSLGGAPYASQVDCDANNAATKAAIDNLRSVGIATVIAAGNHGYWDAISEPGCISSAISVGATDDADEIAGFSNAASFLSLWAPGVYIHAPLYMSSGFVDASGTSMAAPHVAGAWAILKQFAPLGDVDLILAALQETGVPIDDVYADTSRTRVAQALDALPPACANGIDDDEDGLVDYPADLGCRDAASNIEDAACQDGDDNDGDGKIDFDGGFSALGYVAAEPDPQCLNPFKNKETPSCGPCGRGCGLALLVPPITWIGRRRARRAL